MAVRLSGMVSGLDTESIISALVSSYQTKVDNYEKAQTKLSWKQDAWKDLNTDIYSLYSNLSSLRYSSAYATKTTSVSDTTKAKVTASSSAATGTQLLTIGKLATSGYITGAKLGSTTTGSSTLASLSSTDNTISSSTTGTLSLTTGGKTTAISLTGASTVNDVVNKLKDAGIKANYDETNHRVFVSASDSGASNDFTLTSTDDGGAQIMTALGLTTASGATRINGQDMEMTLNGANYTSSTNAITINGLTINALGTTDASSPVSVTTATDTQAVYDKVKDTLTQYNEVVNKMMTLYNANSTTGYEPLTDTEKASMTDSQIEKWESSIKKSLLRRDSTLDGIVSTMTNSMSQSYEINGKKYSLASFGIHTLGYLNAAENENYAYHIDGDSDDTSTSAASDKLMTAITNDPDSVVEFMKDLTSGLYDNLDKKMKSTTLSSAYKVYNDKEMASEYSDYTDLISEWETRLEDMQESYTKKFSSMESALASLQSSTSSISSLLNS